MKILAIDQGTTSTRALLVTPEGITPLISLAHRQHYPRPGWVEHDAEELLANLGTCLASAATTEGVRAVGLANQGESCLGWDARTGEPVGPVIVWQDDRTRDATDRLKAGGAEALVTARAGLPLDPYFSAAKLGWILREIPRARELAAAGRLRLGTTDAFFRDRLTGRFETDVTTASRTSLMNLETCDWDDDLCALFGVPREALPAITASTGDLGRMGGLALTASVVDQQAALFGHGCRAPGDAKITFGTGAFALALSGGGAGTGAVPTIAWQRAGEAPVRALEGGVYAASSAVNWARGLGLFGAWEEINGFDAPPAISRGLAFVPALAGLACPHWDRRARGAWLGLGLETSGRDMVQAVLEGVAFRTAEVMREMGPVRGVVSIDGGMSANPWFCQFLADVLARPIRVSEEPELTALGVAQLAASGAGGRLDVPVRGRILQPAPQPEEWAARFAAARQAVQGFGTFHA
ncbi:glycerol kinase [Cereibacter changlensis JA139]|uniref:ATP:glycerol 3-phosphotransferase n=2 Tax=Cereibacter changlensis TaxID=402884 RepID=A0A2T4JSS1_9RHOB|nr:FGGY family carbohydrate kinase [Cereibacter changlensis]PTE20960.1 glycerol kinase [Cereibacter changlensis JA139]PZX51689.1 glycerol kinase [Cereibacter changlensis]